MSEMDLILKLRTLSYKDCKELVKRYTKQIRNDAIDEFVKELKHKYPIVTNGFGMTLNYELHQKIDDISEQLKENK